MSKEFYLFILTFISKVNSQHTLRTRRKNTDIYIKLFVKKDNNYIKYNKYINYNKVIQVNKVNKVIKDIKDNIVNKYNKDNKYNIIINKQFKDRSILWLSMAQ